MTRKDPNDRAPTAGDGRIGGWDNPPTIALGVDRNRDRELLSELFSAHELRIVTEEVPDDTDLCLVDPGGFDLLREAIGSWKRTERPTVAPVLLLGTAAESELFRRYAGEIGDGIDAVHSVPAPKRAILERVRALLRTRKHSVDARERTERLELYERAMDGAEIGITIADADDSELPLIYANDGFLEVTGYDRSEVIGRNCRFLQGEDTDEGTVDRIRDSLEAAEPISVEIRNYRRSGEQFWNELTIVPVEGDRGDVTHFLGFQRDVTDRRRREIELERHGQVLESIDDPVIVCDGDRRIELVNHAAEQLFGTDEASCGRRVTSLFDPDQRDRLRGALDAVERTGESNERQFELGDEDGRHRIYQFRFEPEATTDDSPARSVLIGRDVTTIREYENRLSVFDRVLRHNLRNKLNVVAGNADVLLEAAEGLSPDEIESIAGSIGAAADGLLELSDSVRAFNDSIEPGESPGKTIVIDEFLSDAVERLRTRHPEAEIEHGASTTAVAEGPRTIDTCLDRVVENAIRYADSPRPAVCISAVDRSETSVVEIRIDDDGPGFPDRERNALNRGAETALEHLQGISLWFVSWALGNVGGELRIEDGDPDGTTVVLSLPRTGASSSATGAR